MALATWRIASLFTGEEGPFSIFANLREVVTWGGVLDCLWCFSVWVGIVLAVAYYFYPVVTYWLCLPLALSGAAIIADRWVNG